MKRLTERSLPEIRAVLFDMDGLLIDSERLWQRSLRETCRRLQYPVSEALGLSMLGKTDRESMRMFREAVPGFDEQAYKAECGARMFELFRTELRAKPGAEALLGRLSERKIPYALASSSGKERVEYSLQCVGLSERFPVRVTGEYALPSKPAPDFFLAAAKALDADPVHCLVLEDSENGVRAGRAAGSTVCMIPDLVPFSERVREACDFVGESLLEIPALIDAVNSSR